MQGLKWKKSQNVGTKSAFTSFFFFFFLPFSLFSWHFLSPFTKNIPLLFSFFSFFPLFFLYSFLLFVFLRTFHRLTELSFSHSSSSYFFFPFPLSTSSVTPMQGIDFFFSQLIWEFVIDFLCVWIWKFVIEKAEQRDEMRGMRTA